VAPTYYGRRREYERGDPIYVQPRRGDGPVPGGPTATGPTSDVTGGTGVRVGVSHDRLPPGVPMWYRVVLDDDETRTEVLVSPWQVTHLHGPDTSVTDRYEGG